MTGIGWSHLALWALLVVSDQAACARQQPELRVKALGAVRTVDGTPWEGADVVLFSRPIAEHSEIGVAGRVTARTDADGKFRARILPCRDYVVWAYGARTAAGQRVTEVAERVVADRPVILHERADPAPDRVLRLAGCEDWKANAPLHVVVEDDLRHAPRYELAVGPSGRVALPLLVGDHAWVEVFGRVPAGTLPIRRYRVALDTAEITVNLPRRFEQRHVALNVPDGGTARVLFELGRRYYHMGTVDGHGHAVLPRGKGGEGLAPRPVAEVDGRRSGYFYDLRGVLERGTEPPEGTTREDRLVVLGPGSDLVGRVLGVGGRPLHDVVIWRSRYLAAGIGGHGPYAFFHRTVTTDARGDFALPGDRGETARGLSVVLRPEHEQLLPEPLRGGAVPRLFAATQAATGAGTPDEPLVIDLRRFCAIELEVRNADRSPAAGAEVAIARLDDRCDPGDHDGVLCGADGRVRVLVPAERVLGLRAVHRGAMWLRAVETPAAGRSVHAVLTLPRPATISGVVLSRDGSPARGVRVSAISERSVHRLTRPRDVGFLPGSSPSGDHLRVVGSPGGFAGRRLVGMTASPVRPDQGGRFELPMPPFPIPGVSVLAEGDERTRGYGGQLGGPDRITWDGESATGVVVRVVF